MLETLVEIKEIPTVRTTMYVAYLIRNKASEMVYVGSTEHPGARISAHKSNLRRGVHENKNLQKLYNESPDIDFVLYEVETREEAFKLEKALIEYFKSRDRVLNLTFDPVNNKLTPELSKLFRDGSKKWSELVSQSVTIEGKEYTSIRAAAEAFKISHSSILHRIKSNKNKFKNWIFTGSPKASSDGNGASNSVLITVDNKTYTLSEYSRFTGVSLKTIQGRYKRGCPIDQLGLPAGKLPKQEMLVTQ